MCSLENTIKIKISELLQQQSLGYYNFVQGLWKILFKT